MGNLIILAAVAVLAGLGTPAFAQTCTPSMSTELDLNLSNPDGSNIDTSLLLTIDYRDCALTLQSWDSVNDSTKIIWSIYNGKSNVYSRPPAKHGTEIIITVNGYESLAVTAVEGAHVTEDYNLNNVTPIPSTTTTTPTVSSTTTTTVSVTTTTVPNATTTVTTTTTTVPITTTLPSGGDGASHVATTVSVKDEKVVMTTPSISSGSSATFTIPSSEETPVRQLVLKVDNEVKDVEVTVSVLTEKPADVETDVGGVLYRYVNISHTISDEKINSATINFNVEKSWTDENNIDPDSVTLNRYSGGKWTALTTTRLSEELDYYAYEAVSPGLSVFSISGSIATEVQTIATTSVTTTTTPQPATTIEPIGPPVTTVPPESKKPIREVTFVILALAIVMFAAYYLRKR